MSEDKSLYMEKKFDVRLTDRHLRYESWQKSYITEKELAKHLSALPDVADKCEPIKTEQPGLSARSMDDDD